jgi:hypothetical protein
VLTGRQKQAGPQGARAEPLGAELAAVAGEGGLEPSEIVGRASAADEAREVRDEPSARGNGHSPAVSRSAGTEPG